MPSTRRRAPSGLRGLAAQAMLSLLVGLAVLASAGGARVDLLETTPPAQAVYGVSDYPVTFDHDAHIGLVECSTCHGAVVESHHAAEAHWPAMDVCAGCHAQAEDTETAAACAFCHPGYRPVWPTGTGFLAVRDPHFPLVAPEPVVHPVRNLVFSHAQHAELACASCHGDPSGGVAELPREHACLECHGGARGSSVCATCHPVGATGLLVTRVAGNAAVPAVALRPRDHDRDWALGHGLAASFDGGAACASCHGQADCQTCHDGTLALDTPHPPGFTLHHAFEARRDTSACASCHSPSGFCVDCHVDGDVSTGETGRPPLGARLHPDGWLATGGGEHAREAQRSLLECASCHAENDCLSCHAFVDPHGSEFFGRCGSLLSANPGVCARCHSDTSRLRALCQ